MENVTAVLGFLKGWLVDGGHLNKQRWPSRPIREFSPSTWTLPSINADRRSDAAAKVARKDAAFTSAFG